MLTGDIMEPLPAFANTGWPFPFTPQGLEQTPSAEPAYLRTMRDEPGPLQDRVETLAARLMQNSMTSSQPSSVDSSSKKPRWRTTSTTPRKVGGKPRYQGHRQVLFTRTHVQEGQLTQCACGGSI